MKIVIETESAPQAIGPYSQAIKTGNLLFLSGQIPLDPQSMEIVEGGIIEQTQQVFKNIGAVLEKAGLSFKNVVKATVFLKDINDFQQVNEIYNQFLGFEATGVAEPARSAFAVKDLPKGALLEIETIASFEV